MMLTKDTLYRCHNGQIIYVYGITKKHCDYRDETSESHRASVSAVLGMVEGVLTDLPGAIRTTVHSWMRDMIAYAMIDAKDKAAIPVLVELIKRRDLEEERATLVCALDELGAELSDLDEEAMAVLKAMEKDEFSEESTEAWTLLNRLGCAEPNEY